MSFQKKHVNFFWGGFGQIQGCHVKKTQETYSPPPITLKLNIYIANIDNYDQGPRMYIKKSVQKGHLQEPLGYSAQNF